jgi:molybdate transport system regulatory protein
LTRPEPKVNALTVRFRVDFGNRSSVGIGKIELLEGIERTGSLSQAAREMHMSYRRAWLLLEDLNTSFDHRVARAKVGGRGGGGVVLTEFGSSLVAGYRRLDPACNPRQIVPGGLRQASQSERAQAAHPSHDQTKSVVTRTLRTLFTELRCSSLRRRSSRRRPVSWISHP